MGFDFDRQGDDDAHGASPRTTIDAVGVPPGGSAPQPRRMQRPPDTAGVEEPCGYECAFPAWLPGWQLATASGDRA